MAVTYRFCSSIRAMSKLQKRNEVCLGVKIKALETDKESNIGITLIPERNTTYALQADDSLVVLAEDER